MRDRHWVADRHRREAQRCVLPPIIVPTVHRSLERPHLKFGAARLGFECVEHLVEKELPTGLVVRPDLCRQRLCQGATMPAGKAMANSDGPMPA